MDGAPDAGIRQVCHRGDALAYGERGEAGWFFVFDPRRGRFDRYGAAD
jgi:hypothetical protein